MWKEALPSRGVQAVLAVEILEQVKVNSKQGGCGNTYGSGKWLGQWKETC